MGVFPAAESALGDEVEDAAAALGIAGIPVLHRAVAHVRILLHYDLHHCRVQLVLIPHRGRAALHVAHASAFVGDYERALELAGAAGVDAEVAAEIHGALDAFGDVAERSVGEDGGVEGCVEVVARWHHGGEVLAHEVGVLLHRLAEATEDDALFGQMLPEGGADGNRVEDGVDRDAALRFHAGKRLTFPERDAEFVESLLEFGVDFGRTVFVFHRGGIVDDVLEVDFRKTAEVAPAGRRHALPFTEGVQTEVQQPLRLSLLRRDEPYGVLREAFRNEFLLDLGFETFTVFPGGDIFQ